MFRPGDVRQRPGGTAIWREAAHFKMRVSQVFIRGVFCVAAACSAASLADAVLESASNAGWFGPGTFTDHSTLDVLPVLAIGGLFAFLYAVARAQLVLRAGDLRRYVSACMVGLDHRAIVRLLPLVFALQMLTLFGMETLEQVAIAGHPMGGTLWLGAPALVSICFHMLIGAIVAVTMGRVLRALSERLVDVVAALLFLLWTDVVPMGPQRLPASLDLFCRRSTMLLRRHANRAPPSLLRSVLI